MSNFKSSHLKKLILVSLSGLLISGCNNDDKKQTTQDTDQNSLNQCTLAFLTKSFDDPNYTVLSTHFFRKGEILALSKNNSTDLQAANNVCVAKVLVDPETNPQDKDQPSYSKGIGIEVWLPDQANWNIG